MAYHKVNIYIGCNANAGSPRLWVRIQAVLVAVVSFIGNICINLKAGLLCPVKPSVLYRKFAAATTISGSQTKHRIAMPRLLQKPVEVKSTKPSLTIVFCFYRGIEKAFCCYHLHSTLLLRNYVAQKLTILVIEEEFALEIHVNSEAIICCLASHDERLTFIPATEVLWHCQV